MERTNLSEEVEKASPISLSGSSGSSSSKIEIGLPLADDHRRPRSNSPQDDLTIVSFEPNDGANPHNWSTVSITLSL
jgi:hypothetical protein